MATNTNRVGYNCRTEPFATFDESECKVDLVEDGAHEPLEVTRQHEVEGTDKRENNLSKRNVVLLTTATFLGLSLGFLFKRRAYSERRLIIDPVSGWGLVEGRINDPISTRVSVQPGRIKFKPKGTTTRNSI